MTEGKFQITSMNKHSFAAALFVLLFSCFLSAQPPLPLDSLRVLASNTVQKGLPDDALQLYLQVLKRAEQENRQDLYADTYYQLAIIHHFQNNNEKSKEQHAQALRYARLMKDSLTLGRCLMLSGIFAFTEEQMDSSVQYFLQSADLFTKIGRLKNAATAMSKVGNIYEGQGNYAAATPIFKQYLTTAQQARDSFLLMTAYINLAGNAYNLRNYPEALVHVNLACDFAEYVKRDFEYQKALELKSLIFEGMDKPKEALQILRQYVQHHDSILNNERTQQITEMQTRFETEKKEATIEQQQQEIRQGNIRFWLITGALLVALLVGGLLFRLTRILRQRNAEKEFLIKEIHHRVKNNLQVLSSLLHLQSRQITDETALDAVREGQNRVDAMGLIHQKLYMGDNMAAVEMQDYLKNLGDTLLDAFGLDDDQVAIHYHLSPMHLDVDTAIPLGLIINELVTNSLKYAFPNGRAGAIEISLWKDDTGKLCLQVADNGVGQALETDLKHSTAFGTNLIHLLSKKLKGKPEVRASEQGYATEIRFEQFTEAPAVKGDAKWF